MTASGAPLALLALGVTGAMGAVGATRDALAATLFIGATLIDGTGAAPLRDAALLVAAERIVAVGPRETIATPSGTTIVEIGGKWIIPGLIDAHVHFFQSGSLYARPDIIDLRARRPYAAERAAVDASLEATLGRYLASGVTGVVDVGGPLWNFEVRERARGARFAPRVAVAGPLLATRAPAALMTDDPPMVRIGSADQARAEVRRQLGYRPDLVKIWFVHPAADIAATMAWVNAAIATSHAAGVRVAVHATQRRIARAVVEAGADVLVHSIDDGPIDPSLLRLMAETGVTYIATLVVHEGYGEVLGMRPRLSPIERRLGDPAVIASFGDLASLPRHLVPAWVRSRPPPRLSPIMAENLRRARAADITIAAGSDAGNIGTLHGPALHRELELMVEAGLSPMQVLMAATKGGAAVMGRRDVGTLVAGQLADFVILDRDPLRDIRHTRRIHRVVKGGEVYEPAAIMAAFDTD